MRHNLNNNAHWFALCVLFTAALFIVTSVSHASANPRVIHQASYQGEYEGLDVDLTRTLVHLGANHYRLEAHAENFLGKVKEHEDFLWLDDGSIQPLAYRYKQRIFGISRQRAIDFDWQRNIAVCREKGKARQVALQQGVLGPMSYQLKLQLDLMNKAKVFDYTFVRRRKVKQYHFTLSEQGPLTEGKTHIENGIKLERKHEDGNRSTTIWFDADKHFTLAALIQEKDDDEHSLFIKNSHFNYPLTGTAFERLIQNAGSHAKH